MEQHTPTQVILGAHTYRNPVAVFFFSIITFGIYAIVWFIMTKDEMNREGAGIPTAWYLIVPLLNVYWVILYCRGIERVTHGKYNTWIAFLLLWVTSCLGMAIIQSWFNEYWGLDSNSAF